MRLFGIEKYSVPLYPAELSSMTTTLLFLAEAASGNG